MADGKDKFWDDLVEDDDGDFFGIKDTAVAVPATTAEAEPTETSTKKPVMQGGEEEIPYEEDGSTFGQEAEEEQPEPKTEELSEEEKKKQEELEAKKKEEASKEENELKNFIVNNAKELIKRGMFSNVENVPDDLNDEQFFELQENELETRVTNRINTLSDKLGEEGMAIINHVNNGGDPHEYYKTMYSKPDLSSIDITTEEGVESAAMTYLQSYEDKDYKESQAYVAFLKDKGNLEDTVKGWQDKADKLKSKKKTELQESQRLEKERKLQERKELKSTYLKMANERDAFGDLKMKKSDLKSIPSYLTDQSVALEDGRNITPLYSDLSYVLSKPNLVFQLGIILKNMDKENEKFNFPGVGVKAKKEVKKKVKSALLSGEEGTTNKPVQSSVNIETASALADYF